MTISNTTCRTSAIGTGAAQTISFSFPVTADTDLTVIKRLISTGSETAMVETTDYTVSINSDGTGSITTVSPYVASTYQIHIIRDTPDTQATDFTAGGALPATSIEAALDKLTKLCMENADTVSRCLCLPHTDPAGTLTLPSSIARAGMYLTFDANGNPTAAVQVAQGTVTFGAFGLVLAATATASAARTALSLGTVSLLASDTDGTLATNTDAVVPTEKAIVTYTNANFAPVYTATAGAVDKTHAQTISGVKTFSVSPIVPDPTTALQAANKEYVDAQGKVIVQVVNAHLSTADTTATAYATNAVPTTSGGKQVMSLAVTPASSTDKLLVEASIVVSASANANVTVALFNGGTNAVASVAQYVTATSPTTVKLSYYVAAGGTSPITFTLRIGASTGSAYFNSIDGSTALLGGNVISTLNITEIKA